MNRDLRGALLLAGSLLLSTAPAAAAPAPEDTKLARATSRCIKLMDLISCADALNRRPNSPELLVAEADALMQLKRPGEAIGVYRNALTVGANPAVLNPRIAGARSLRRSLLQTCLVKQGVMAEQACEAAWLPGAPDEVAVFKRRGLLLQSNGASSAALDAYMSAARLAPKDRAVARAIAALVPATGRQDQPALSALAAARDRLRADDRVAVSHGTATPEPGAPGPATAATPASSAPAAPDTFTNVAEATRSN